MTARQDRIAAAQAIWRDASWDEVAAFIGPNAENYRTAFENTRQKTLEKGHGIALGWSWPAFVFGFAFFLYRKQWAIGAMLIVAPIVFGYFLEVGSAFTGIAIVMAMYAKSFIVQHAVARIAKIEAAGVGTDQITAAGGVSMAGGIVGGVLWVLALASVALSVLDPTL